MILHEMLREVFSTIDGAMLTTSATKGHLQVGEVTFDKPRHVMVDKGIDGVQESQYLAVLFEEVDDGLVETGESLVLLVLTGVVRTTAVEDVTASVAGSIGRNTLFIRE
jgi:hypothetical protein